MLLAMESFDGYGSAAEVLQRTGMLQWPQTAYANLSPGRVDGVGQCFSLQTGFPLNASLAANLSVGFIGFAVKLVTQFGFTPSFRFDAIESNSSATQFSILLDGHDFSITYPGGRTTNNLFTNDTWMFLEIGFVISKTAGSIVIRINNVVVLSVNNINTSPNTSNLWMNGFSVIAPYMYISASVDDLYICDNVASPGPYPCNGFLGDHRIYALYPSSAGDVTAWTPLAGTNFSQVAVNDADASYNASSTQGAEDLFRLTALPSSVVEVLAVQMTGRYKKADATAHLLTQRLKSGNSDVAGVGFLTPYSLSTTYSYYNDIIALDPAINGAWTVAAVNACQIGYRLEA